MADLIECLNCGEEYPPVACRWKCPSCEWADGSYDKVHLTETDDDDF